MGKVMGDGQGIIVNGSALPVLSVQCSLSKVPPWPCCQWNQRHIIKCLMMLELTQCQWGDVPRYQVQLIRTVQIKLSVAVPQVKMSVQLSPSQNVRPAVPQVKVSVQPSPSQGVRAAVLKTMYPCSCPSNQGVRVVVPQVKMSVQPSPKSSWLSPSPSQDVPDACDRIAHRQVPLPVITVLMPKT